MIKSMQKINKTDIIIILFIFFLAIGIQFFFLNPPVLTDQMEYYFTAIRFPRLPSNPNIGSMRIGLELPVAILYRIFGSSEVAYYTVPLLSFALLAISIYLIGKGLFSRRIGFFSALLVMIIPNLLQESGHLLPDVPATALASTGFAVVITAFGNKNDERNFASRKSRFLFILAGILFGWSYLVKEYLAILFFLIPLIFWILEIPFRNLVPVAVAMLIMYGMEVAIGIIYYKNPLIRFLAASPRETEGEIQKDIPRIISYFGRLLVKSGGDGILILMCLGVVNTIVSSFRKKKRYIFLLALIFNWQDIVLMRLHKFRYWIPILPPMVIAGVALLDKISLILYSKIKNINISARVFCSILITILISLVSIHGIITIQDDPDFIRNGADHYLELRQFLKENDDSIDVIWINRDNKRAFERILPMYIRTPFGKLIWHGTFKYINTDDLYLRADEIDTGYIIVDRDFMIPEVYGVPDYLANPPADWKMVFESQNKKLALFAVN